jgi:hypothetical protein
VRRSRRALKFAASCGRGVSQLALNDLGVAPVCRRRESGLSLGYRSPTKRIPLPGVVHPAGQPSASPQRQVEMDCPRATGKPLFSLSSAIIHLRRAKHGVMQEDCHYTVEGQGISKWLIYDYNEQPNSIAHVGPEWFQNPDRNHLARIGNAVTETNSQSKGFQAHGAGNRSRLRCSFSRNLLPPGFQATRGQRTPYDSSSRL